MASEMQKNINYFTSRNSYVSGAVDLTVVREELHPTGLIIPSGIALFELENQDEGHTDLPLGWVHPTEEEVERILATRQYKEDSEPNEEGEHFLEVVGNIDSLHDALVGFVSHAIRAQNQVVIRLDISTIRPDEKACIESVSDAVRRIHSHNDAYETESYAEPSEGYGLYL